VLKYIEIEIVDDDDWEDDERFWVDLSDPKMESEDFQDSIECVIEQNVHR